MKCNNKHTLTLSIARRLLYEWLYKNSFHRHALYSSLSLSFLLLLKHAKFWSTVWNCLHIFLLFFFFENFVILSMKTIPFLNEHQHIALIIIFDQNWLSLFLSLSLSPLFPLENANNIIVRSLFSGFIIFDNNNIVFDLIEPFLSSSKSDRQEFFLTFIINLSPTSFCYIIVSSFQIKQYQFTFNAIIKTSPTLSNSSDTCCANISSTHQSTTIFQ